MQITSPSALSQILSSISPAERGEPPRTQDVHRAEAQLRASAPPKVEHQVASGGAGQGA